MHCDRSEQHESVALWINNTDHIYNANMRPTPYWRLGQISSTLFFGQPSAIRDSLALRNARIRQFKAPVRLPSLQHTNKSIIWIEATKKPTDVKIYSDGSGTRHHLICYLFVVNNFLSLSWNGFRRSDENETTYCWRLTQKRDFFDGQRLMVVWYDVLLMAKPSVVFG